MSEPVCAICGDLRPILDSAKPSYLSQSHAEVWDGSVFWFYCFDCNYHLNEIAARRKKNKLVVLVLPGPSIEIEIKGMSSTSTRGPNERDGGAGREGDL